MKPQTTRMSVGSFRRWDIDWLRVLAILLVVVLSSFLITLGLVELLIRPFKPMRRLFGMKPRRRKEVKD